jgi:hypothetical protein
LQILKQTLQVILAGGKLDFPRNANKNVKNGAENQHNYSVDLSK